MSQEVGDPGPGPCRCAAGGDRCRRLERIGRIVGALKTGAVVLDTQVRTAHDLQLCARRVAPTAGMSAMTMAFPPKDPAMLRELQEGDNAGDV